MPFPETVLEEFAKRYLEAQRGLWLKTKYPKIKTEKKLFEELLSVLLIHLRDLQLSVQEAFRKDCSFGIGKVIFGRP